MNSIENEKLQQMNTPNGGYRLKEAVKAMINYGSLLHTGTVSRVEKYGLAKRIRETMYDMLHLCNVIQKKYYKRDTLREFDTLLLDLRDYLDEAANPRLYPQATEPKKKRKKRADGQAPEAPPQPVTCITMHQYATWSKYTGAIGGMIGNYISMWRASSPNRAACLLHNRGPDHHFTHPDPGRQLEQHFQRGRVQAEPEQCAFQRQRQH